MKRYPSIYLQCSLILFVLCFANSGCYAQILELSEGDVCNEGSDGSSDSVCRRIENCMVVSNGIQNNIRPQLCSFIGSVPVVCCPPDQQNTRPNPPTPRPNPPTSRPNPPTSRPNPSTSRPNPPTSRPNPPTPRPNPPSIPLNTPTSNTAYSAKEMCHEYSSLIYTYQTQPTLLIPSSSKNKTAPKVKVRDCLDIKPLIVGGDKAKAKEFPHMVLLGYDEKPLYDYQRCGGSLISKKWVLTAAHCEKLGPSTFATWARVGELNFKTTFGKDIPKDYRVVQRVIHPNYNGAVSSYDDIALFRLEQDVEFSPYVRPLCLNTDQSLTPQKLLATGWGKLNYDEGVTQDLQKVVLNHTPVNQCRSLFSGDSKLPRGIDETSMICAGDLKGGKDTCSGDSGGPLQIINVEYPCMYTQVGLTSFGTRFCGTPNTAGVYTRISNYISWIEPIVWPKNL